MSLELATTHKSQAAPDIPCCRINFSNYLHTSDSENNYFPSDTWASPVAQLLKNPPANAGDTSDVGSIPGLGRYPGEGNGNPLQYPEGKESTCNVGGPGFDPWAGKIPWRREQLPTPVFWPGEFHGLYSPWGRKESDTIERLSLHFTSIQYYCLENSMDGGAWT